MDYDYTVAMNKNFNDGVISFATCDKKIFIPVPHLLRLVRKEPCSVAFAKQRIAGWLFCQCISILGQHGKA